jgi:hypothetical protein
MRHRQPSLPSNRAFVVQFRAQDTDAPLSWEGRVEHLSSGQVLRFHSPEELLAFLARMLTDVQEPPWARKMLPQYLGLHSGSPKAHCLPGERPERAAAKPG